MTTKKQSFGIPKVAGTAGPKYDSAAKGGDLAKGVSHYEGKVNVDSMYARPEAESNQKMPSGSDRI